MYMHPLFLLTYKCFVIYVFGILIWTRTEGQMAIISYVETCLFQIRHTSSPSMKIHQFSTRSDNHASTVFDTKGDTRETTSEINHASAISYIRDTTVQCSGSTESVTSGMSNKSLIIGITTGAAVFVSAVIIMIILRKRLTRRKRNNDICLEAVYENMNEQEIFNNQIEALQAVSSSATLEQNQRNNVYDVIDKGKQTDNQKGADDSYTVLNIIEKKQNMKN